jgi:hypothetical protein
MQKTYSSHAQFQVAICGAYVENSRIELPERKSGKYNYGDNFMPQAPIRRRGKRLASLTRLVPRAFPIPGSLPDAALTGAR